VGGPGSGPSRRIRLRLAVPAPLLGVVELRRTGRLGAGVSWCSWRGALAVEFLTGERSIRYRWNAPGDHAADREVIHEVALTTTPCNYGGERRWFVCPRCELRVANLYARGRPPLLCRRCAGIRYPSQVIPTATRRVFRAAAIRERLGGEPSLLEPFPQRPPRMHRTTYDRLRDEVLDAEQAYLLATEDRAQAVKRRVERLRASSAPKS
jgi:hypothetical protein